MRRRVIDITRRQLLLGAGGVVVGLPILPSLLTKTAYGADPTFTRAPRLYWLTSEHGGAFESSAGVNAADLARRIGESTEASPSVVALSVPERTVWSA